MRFSLLSIVLVAWTASATAADRSDLKTKAVQAATLAKLAPLTCDGMGTDEKAVAEFLQRAGVDQQELFDHYQKAMRDVAATLERSVNRDKEAACAQLWNKLGEEGLGLVTDPEDKDDGE